MDLVARQSTDIDTLPLEGRIIDDPVTPGRYGRAVINGVQFALTSIELRLGAMIFECSLMIPARYAFTIRPGDTARIYGTDGQLVADYAVPGLTGETSVCEVRPGDVATVFLPLRFEEIHSASPEDRRRFNNVAVSGG